MHKAKKIHLIRHTSPDIASGICYGQSDLALSNRFLEETANIKQRLNEPNYHTVYTSPLKRCRQLAEQLNYQQIIDDRRLMEMNFGDWELQHWDHINRDELDHWMNDFVHAQTPNGESMLMMNQRVQEFITELAGGFKKAETGGVTTAVITHAGVIRLIAAWVLGIPLGNSFRLAMDYGATFELDLHPDPQFCQIKACA